ncbi:MAG: HAD family hydrolase [Verrucomicrobiae bacterium]|nr:HAD family hydrolase [Verrucomicrobiae bacterium]MCP5540714.1 HAD family hydrolase [Akkermansiaceae bacterium]
MHPHAETFRLHAAPLEPIPTGECPRLANLEGLRAVVFDIYGTLLISAAESGRERRDPAAAGQHLRQTLESFPGLRVAPAAGDAELAEAFIEADREHRDRLRGEGIEFPEPDIRAVWRGFLDTLAATGRLTSTAPGAEETESLIVTCECLANPVWPMPGLAETLAGIRKLGSRLGIVSNAQFYTRHLFPALLGNDLEGLGFDPTLMVFSHELRESKPSPRLYEILAEKLERQGIPPAEALYIGNDLRNDIWPARSVGFKTSLFAGDARSLRWRGDDPRLAGVTPDLVVTDLRQILDCLV